MAIRDLQAMAIPARPKQQQQKKVANILAAINSVASMVATSDFLLRCTLLGSNSCLFGAVGVMSKVTSPETIVYKNAFQ